MAGKRWTKEEEQQLIELYKTNTVKEISSILDRTEGSISNKCKRLELSKDTQSLDTVNKRVQEKFPNLEFIEYKGAREYSLIKDIRCGHTWTTRPEYVYSRGLTTKCPTCNNLKKSTEQFKEEVYIINPDIEVLEDYIDSKTYIQVKYRSCGHIGKINPNGFLVRHRGAKCSLCNSLCNNTKKSQDQFAQEIQNITNNIQLLEAYTNSKTYIQIQYKSCKHLGKIKPNEFLNRGTGIKCPTCNPKRKLNEQFNEEAYIINPDLEVLGEYIGNKEYILVRSKECGHEWEIHPRNFISYSTGTKCPICNNIGSSKGERAISELLSKYTTVETSNRSILEGLEIDIYLPEFKIGIEYNGEYWHSEDKKGKNYHLDKTKLAESKGIRLIQIFEHEWLQKQNIVKSRLLGMLQQNYKLGARKCSIKELPFSEVRSFLDDNHLQGAGSSSNINIGLYYKEILVAVMTFSKPRFNSNYDYELIRYASLTGINIQGGASKLLKYFTNKYKGSIISYSDKRWSQGSLYKTLGFVYTHTSEPGYFYAKNNSILSRYKCQKHRLKELLPDFYKDELTETEIMASARYYKVFDCGTDVWAYGTKE